MEILELKSITELKNSTEEVNSRCEKSEVRISKYKNKCWLFNLNIRDEKYWRMIKVSEKCKKQVYQHTKNENIRGRQEREKRGKYLKP